MYLDSVDGMFEHLWVSHSSGLDYIAEFKGIIWLHTTIATTKKHHEGKHTHSHNLFL